MYSPRLLRLLALLCAFIALLALALAVPRGVLYLQADLLWNVFLAALPLVFALMLHRRRALGRRGPLSGLLWALWLAFFPNAPYMVTDFIHLDHYRYYGEGRFIPSISAWLGLAHLTLAVATGCVCGFLSLYLVQQLAAGRGGAARPHRGWALCAGACLLAGAGIYIGRFLRFNSWDLLHRPLALLAELAARPAWHTLALCLLFAAFTFGGHLLFYCCWHRPAGGAE